MKYLIKDNREEKHGKPATRGYCGMLSYMLWGKYFAGMYWC